VSATLSLDNKFTASASAWNRYHGDLIGKNLPNISGDVDVRQVAIVFVGEDVDGQDKEKSIHALKQAAEAADFDAELLFYSDPDAQRTEIREHLDSLSTPIPFLFIKPGDLVVPEFFSTLRPYLDRPLILFDLCSRERDRVLPILLPGINPVHAAACNYFRSRCVLSSESLKRAQQNGCRLDPHALAAFVFADLQQRSEARKALHIPLPLIFVSDEARQITADRFLTKRRLDFCDDHRSVSAIICTRDRPFLLHRLVGDLLQRTNLKEIVIVSNQTQNPYALALLEDLRKNKRVKILRYDEPFNYSRQCNFAASHSTGETLLFLNDDLVPIADDWLSHLLHPIQRGLAGIAGALLLYPDERVQHAGAFLGYNGVGGHTLRFSKLPDQEYLFMASALRQVSWVTGAVLAIEATLFNDLNGFDENLATYLQDVDLCMRAGACGHATIFVPDAVLLHMESITLKENLSAAVERARHTEFEIFSQRWGDLAGQDPFHNPNFSISDEALRNLSAGAGLLRQREGRL
jgi:GT2 family glycosyltransferase